MRTKKHRTPHHLSSRTLGFIAFVAVGTIYYVYSQLPQPTPVTINEVAQAPTGTVDLSLTSPLIAPNQTATVNLQISAGETKVSAVAIELTYDPTSLQIPDISRGDFFSVTLANPKIDNGKISFVYAVAPDSGGKNGSGTVATLRFSPKRAGNSAFTFTSNTLVAAVGDNSNALRSASSASIQVEASATTREAIHPTPTPQATPSFLPEQDWDYAVLNQTGESPIPAPTDTRQSLFVRFLRWLKSTLGKNS